MIFVLLFIWYFIGVVFLTLSWINDFDLRSEDVPVMLICGAMGPLAILIFLSKLPNSKVLIKRRGKYER